MYDKYKQMIGESVPKTFEEFQNLKYNDVNEFNKIRTSYRDKTIQNNVRSGKYNLTVLQGRQGKHIHGHNNYMEGKGIVEMTFDEIQALVDRTAGTGRIVRDSKGHWTKKEIITDDAFKGIFKSLDGVTQETNTFNISYGKDGTHIIPRRKGMS